MPTVSTPSSTPVSAAAGAEVGTSDAVGAVEPELAQAVMDRIMSRDRITDPSYFILRSTFLFAFSHFGIKNEPLWKAVHGNAENPNKKKDNPNSQ